MNYCTQQNLIDRYSETELIQLTDHDNTGEINVDVLNRAISDADGEIDSYLASRYDLPISPVPKTIERAACDIARYYLYDDSATEHVTKRYDDAVKFLKSIAAGTVSIGIDATGSKPESNNSAIMTSGGNVFNRKDNGFI